MAPDWNEVAFMRVMRVNLLGPINLVRAILPGMIQRRRGHIALCGSIAGWTGGVLAAPHYSASKGGVHALIRWFAQRATPHGVNVNGVAPGPIATGMTQGADYRPEAYPMKRMGEPEEVAAALRVFVLARCRISGRRDHRRQWRHLDALVRSWPNRRSRPPGEGRMYKVVTVYKRKPGMDVEAFQRRWLEGHAPLVCDAPRVAALRSIAHRSASCHRGICLATESARCGSIRATPGNGPCQTQLRRRFRPMKQPSSILRAKWSCPSRRW